jgi:hypothetical protein
MEQMMKIYTDPNEYQEVLIQTCNNGYPYKKTFFKPRNYRQLIIDGGHLMLSKAGIAFALELSDGRFEINTFGSKFDPARNRCKLMTVMKELEQADELKQYLKNNH